MKRIVRVCVLIICVFVSMGCSTATFEESTPTPALPSGTSEAPVITPTRTPLLTQTSPATAKPPVQFGERHEITKGGFSLSVPIGYTAQIEETQAFISDVEGLSLISFVGVESSSSEEQIVDEYLSTLAKRSQGKLEKTPSDPVTIDGVEGKAFDVTGSIYGSSVQGKTFIVPIRANHFLFGLAVSNVSKDEAAWEEQGSKAFAAIVQSIEWIRPPSEGNCPIATDETYGHTKENAIRVGNGGDVLGGPARERAYLDNLRGPDGEQLVYERVGSINFEDTILDQYVITGLEVPDRLYIDIYKFEELKAPVGFTCAGPFNIQP